MDRKRIARICGTVPLAFVLLLSRPLAVSAQDVNEEYIVNHLGPAAEDMQWSGVDGSPESTPAMIEIGQRWGIDPAYWISVDEVRMLVRGDREDREARERQASLRSPMERYPSRMVLARFGVVSVGLTCGQAQEKARTAQRLADTLSRISQLNFAGTGLVGALSQGATRFVAPMAFATAVTGFASVWASQLAAGYRNATCLAGGQIWRFRPNVLKTSLLLDPSRIPFSLPGQPGSACVPSLSGRMFRPRMLAYRSSCPSAFGPSRSS
jgi:hypothetical protein